MKRSIIFLVLLSLVSGFSSCKEEKDDSNLAMAAMSLMTTNPLVGDWTYTGGSVVTSSTTYDITVKSGTGIRSFISNEYTDKINAVYLWNNVETSTVCTGTVTYALSGTTITGQVTSGNCETVGEVISATYSISGNNLTITRTGYKSSLGDFTETSNYTKN